MTLLKTVITQVLCTSLLLPAISALAEPVQPVELRISWWGGNQRHTATLEAINAFQQAFPSIKVKPEYSGWDGYLSRLSTQLAGHQEPDVMRIDWNWLPQFSRTGEGFLNLTPLGEALGSGNFAPQYLKMAEVNGKLQGLPISMTYREFIYNKNTWQQAGIAYPKTWDELFAAGETFRQKLGEGSYPLGVAQGAADALDILSLGRTYMAQKYGIDLIDEKKRSLAYSDQQVKELFSFYKKLVDSHVIPGQRYFSSFGRANIYEIQPWIKGELAGMYLWDSSIFTYSSNLPKTTVMEVGPFISLPDAKDSAINNKPSSLFAISKSTKHANEAALLLNFLLNDKRGVTAVGLQNGIPSSQQAEKFLEQAGIMKADNLVVAAYRAAASQPATHIPVSPFMENQELVQLWTTSVQRLDYGNGTVEEVSKDFQRNASRILKRAIR